MPSPKTWTRETNVVFTYSIRLKERAGRVYTKETATGVKADNTDERHIYPARGLSEDVRENPQKEPVQQQINKKNEQLKYLWSELQT